MLGKCFQCFNIYIIELVTFTHFRANARIMYVFELNIGG